MSRGNFNAGFPPDEDIIEFAKLFKINLPIAKYYLDYFRILDKTGSTVIKDFRDFLAYRIWVHEKTDYKSIQSYKLDFALKKAVNYIKESDAFKRFNSFDFGNEKTSTKDIRGKEKSDIIISFDINAANWSVLKTFEKEREFSDLWEDFLVNDLGIHPFLSRSKSFRQYIFGNTNPKKFHRAQSLITRKTVDKVVDVFNVKPTFISHDEFQIRINDLSKDQIYGMQKLVLDHSLKEGILFKNEIFTLTPIRKKMYIKSIMNEDREVERHELFSVPSNLIYPYMRKYILREPLKERDLMFTNDGFIAKWEKDQEEMFPTIMLEHAKIMDV